MTCTAFRNLLGETSCQFGGNFACGQGGTCVNDVCSVACTVAADCPYGSTCEDNPDGDSPAKVCVNP